MRSSRRRTPLAALVVAALALAACSDRNDAGAPALVPAAAGDAAAAEQTPSGPCPAELVIQTDWFPEIEHGGTYQLIGNAGTPDKDTLSYRGPLSNRYRGDHGVRTVEIRAGGAAIDGRSVVEVLYADEDVLLGYVNTDDAVAAHLDGKHVVGVAATLDLNPQMLMWSPARFSISQFGDLARTRAPVLHFPGMTYVDYLVAQGYVSAEQLDDSYQGDPSRWLEAGGDVIQQGFVTNEVFTYENLVDGWRRPVDFFLIHWMGYENYPAMVSVRADRMDAARPCLEALVPVLQQAWVDFLEDPEVTSRALVAITDAYDTFFTISEDLNRRALEMFEEFKLATNGSDDTYGNFDLARVGRLTRIVEGILAERGTPLPRPLSEGDVVTNDFIDPAISLRRSTS